MTMACEAFQPNAFKAQMCRVCFQKKEEHAGLFRARFFENTRRDSMTTISSTLLRSLKLPFVSSFQKLILLFQPNCQNLLFLRRK